MVNVIQVASYIYNRYHDEYNTIIDEMKLHKLLYFTQRESIIMTGEPMFADQFEAWKYGPVLVQIRDCYRNKSFNHPIDNENLTKYQSVFDYVFANYANKSSWSLSMLSHGEISWQRARNNTPNGEKSTSLIAVEDIREDAERIKTRRFYFNEILPKISANK
jgi:uncharacterized phage-associated protein